MRRESSSRPNPSVPSQCAAENDARRSSMSMSVGDGSGSRSANSETAKTSSIQLAAAQNTGPSRRFRVGGAATPSSRPSSSVAMADPRVQNGVKHVDNEVHDDEARGHQQHHALHDDQIASIDRANDQ